ncbi:MAG: Mrp/NBP35 family ATP-binding protein [archaeon YNP-LCB-024-027]|nr:Mrp/NBP35 family ATP-binding protein [Candidatus Culexarchaeum yellowstonense]
MSEMREAYKRVLELDEAVKRRMGDVRYKIAVLSGKGGVGKSVVTANLALALASRGRRGLVGILDADITGPTIPKLLNLRGRDLLAGPNGIEPIIGPLDVKVVSMDYLLPNDYTPVIWRGPLKSTAIKQFLGDINWGKLDFLFIDLPPGTGDEPLTIAQSIPNITGAIIITIPSEVSQIVVKRAVGFCRVLNIPIIGVVENMSGFVCPNCGAEVDIFMRGGGERIALEMGLDFLGRIPLDRRLCEASDKGELLVLSGEDTPTVMAFMNIAAKVEDYVKRVCGSS